MDRSEQLLFQRSLLNSKHLAELCKNAASDTKDWCQLITRHREEILAVDLAHFDNWQQQRDDIAQLSSFHFEKRVILKERQRRECE